jgi:hypothetical protein
MTRRLTARIGASSENVPLSPGLPWSSRIGAPASVPPRYSRYASRTGGTERSGPSTAANLMNDVPGGGPGALAVPRATYDASRTAPYAPARRHRQRCRPCRMDENGFTESPWLGCLLFAPVSEVASPLIL